MSKRYLFVEVELRYKKARFCSILTSDATEDTISATSSSRIVAKATSFLESVCFKSFQEQSNCVRLTIIKQVRANKAKPFIHVAVPKKVDNLGMVAFS